MVAIIGHKDFIFTLQLLSKSPKNRFQRLKTKYWGLFVFFKGAAARTGFLRFKEKDPFK
jgi:hypothetical protein